MAVTVRTKLLAAAILTATSWMLWAFALIPIQMSGLQVGSFGLAASLPLVFYFASVILSIAFVVNLATQGEGRWRDVLFVSQIALLITFLFVTTALIEPFPRFESTYTVMGLTSLVTATGTINPNVSTLFNWPGAWALFSTTFQVLASSEAQLVFVKYYTVFVEATYGILLFVLYRGFFSKRQTYLALFLFYIMNYVGQDYLSSESVAYILFLAFLAILFAHVIRGPTRTIQYPSVAVAFVMFITFLSLVVTHFLTSFALLVFFFIVAYSSRVVAKVRLDRFVPPYVLGFIGWMLFGSAAYFDYIFHLEAAAPVTESLPSAVSQGVQPGIAAGKSVVGSVSSATHAFIANVGITWALFVAAVGIAWFVYRYIRTRKLEKIDAAFIALLIGTAPIIVLPGYSGELLFRGFLLVLPALAYFLVKNARFRVVQVAVVIILLAGPMLHVVVAYGNESFNYVSPSELSGYNFFNQTVSNASVYAFFPIADYFSPQNYSQQNILKLDALINGGQVNASLQAQLLHKGPSYVFFTRGDGAFIETLYATQFGAYQDAQNRVTTSPYFNLIYSSSGVDLYQVRPQ
ncbi:MAG: hypothetical protein ABSD89_07715 [Halobacteriota archaeon]